MTDPLFFRNVEIVVICLGAIFFGYLGYRLFIFGVTEGKSKFEAETQVVRLVFSGTAPGLFFMFAGASILVVALLMRQTHTEGSEESRLRGGSVPTTTTSAAAESKAEMVPITGSTTSSSAPVTGSTTSTAATTGKTSSIGPGKGSGPDSGPGIPETTTTRKLKIDEGAVKDPRGKPDDGHG